MTYSLKSVRNHCVIEVFGGVVCVVTLLFGFFSVGLGAFVIGLSKIFFIFLQIWSYPEFRQNSI